MLSSRICPKQGTVQLAPTTESSFVKAGIYCYFYRARWWWLPTISSLASSILEGRFANPRPSFGKLSPAFLRTKVELMTSASLRNLSNISKATCDNTEFNYPQCAWKRIQGILSDRMGCTHSSGEGGDQEDWSRYLRVVYKLGFFPDKRGCRSMAVAYRSACPSRMPAWLIGRSVRKVNITLDDSVQKSALK